MTQTAIPQIVIDIANLQRSVIPVGTNKLPLVKWKPYQSQRADIPQLEAWQKQFHPQLWGQVTGAISGIITLDHDGDAGRKTMERLGLDPHRQTGSGGFQTDFQYPGWIVKTENSKSSAKKPWAQAYPGLDIRGDGGYAAIAGRNEKGPYQWLRDPAELYNLDVLPTDLREWLGLLYSPESNVAQRALEKYLSEASWKGRDNACFELAVQLRDNNCTQSEAYSICSEFAHRCSSTNQKGEHEPFTEADARAKVDSAYSYAKREPWGSTTTYRTHTGVVDELIYSSGDNGLDVQFILEKLDEGEYGDSLLFAKLFRGKVLYDLTAQEWYKWAGHWWVLDEEGTVKHLVSGKLASVYLQACATLHLQATGQNDEAYKRVKEQIKQLQARAFSLRQISRCKNILSFVQSHQGMSITGNRWDRNPWLLAVQNGVLCLKSGELRQGQPEDYIRTVSPTTWEGLYSLAARFEQFLHEIFADRPETERIELIAFLQRLFGYGITGEVIEHVFAVLWGEDGRNGKDTLQLALSHSLGIMSGAISKDVLIDTGRSHSAGAPTPHLSDLQGKRLAWASEPERGARFSVGKVKELSGGGEIPTRGLHEKKITKIQPSHLLILLTNHKPHADASDSAFWDRLRLITFNMRFVDNPVDKNERKKDPMLWEKLKAEASGILAWLVRGCLEWQKIGLATPQQVLSSVNDYRAEEDIIHLFIQDCCIISPQASVQSSVLYAEYNKWGKESNMYVLDKNKFGIQLAKKYEKARNAKGQTIYKGLGLLDQNPSNDPNSSLKTSPSVFEGPEGDFRRSSDSLEPSPEQGLGTMSTTYTEYPEVEKQHFPKNGSYEGTFLEKPVSRLQGIQYGCDISATKQPPVGYEEVLKATSGGLQGLQKDAECQYEDQEEYEEYTI